MFKSAKLVKWRNAPPPAFADQQAFDLLIPIERSWSNARRKVLLVLEHVDTEDLKKRQFFTGPANSWVESAIDLGLDYAKHLSPKRPSFAAINFNFFKTYDLDGQGQTRANELAAARVHAYAKKIGATDVIIFGDVAAAAIIGNAHKDERTLLMRRGRPHQHNGIYWTNTISLSQAYQGKFADAADEEEEAESKIDHANLLGYVSRCLGNALCRKIVHTIDVQPNVRYVDTFVKFRKLYRKLMVADRVSTDTETTSLGRVVNNVLTIQFAFDANTSYVIPLDHKDAPWTIDEKKKIVRGLRNFFTRPFDPLEKRYDRYLLGQNLKFDLTVLRQRLRINMIHWPIWDMMAGEYCLDENMKALVKCRTMYSGKIGAYSLEWMCAWYGCDFYANNAFSKDDRATIETRALKEPGLLEYCGMDAQVCWGIHDAQRARAGLTLIKGRPYSDRYAKFIVTQMSNMIHIESVMEHRGDKLDLTYLMKLKDRYGPLSVAKREVETEFKKFPSVIKTNAQLAKAEGLPSKTLWGGGAPWVFSATKPSHKLALFIDRLRLEPIAFGKTGPKIDKEFQEKYKETPEVAAFTQLSQLDKLKSTYVNGFYNKLKEDPDMRTDYRIRPGFGFTGTVTGRSNSYDPNLQNIPQRGKFAKFIKRLFVAPEGCLILKMDYSSHEVRMWGIISGDAKLCSLFVNGRWLRQQYRATGKQVFKELMDTKGDIHKVNCEFFFKVEAKDVTKEQRNSVKSIVFGAIYGRGAKAIAKQAGASVESIKDILAQFFKRFTKASGWLEMAKKHAVDHGYMYSPIWRNRNMYTHLYGIDNLVAATERRGCNAPVQGFAADIGHTAGTLYQYHLEKVVREFELDNDKVLRAGVNTFVHDAIKTDAPYEYLLVCLQVLQWCATTGSMQYYKNHWGIKFDVEIEVEFELAAHDNAHYKWDWHEGNEPTLDKGEVVGGGLRFIIRKALEDQKEVYPHMDVDAAEKKIWAIKKNKPLWTYLNKNYPVLSDWPDATHIDTASSDFKKGLGKMIREAEREAVAA